VGDGEGWDGIRIWNGPMNGERNGSQLSTTITGEGEEIH